MTEIATECPRCPQGIRACAHLGDRVVWLLDNVAHSGRHRLIERWSVYSSEWHRAFHTDSLPDAEAEFERRCALLRAEV